MSGYCRRQQKLLFCLILDVAFCASLLAQPKKNAEALLHQFWSASGGENWPPLLEAEVSGSITLGGTTGTFQQTIDLKHGRDVVQFKLGPLQGTQANLTDSSWEKDASGVVTLHDGPGARVEAIDASFQDRNGWFRLPANELEYIGARTEDGSSFDLIGITPPGGRRMVLWLNANDHLLRRVDIVGSDHFNSRTYFSDYRKIQGVLFPFSVRQSNGDTSQDTIQTATSVRLASTLHEAIFQVPPSGFADAHLLTSQDSAQMPFTMADGRIVVNVSINGQKDLPFLLDTGAQAVITPEAAKSLGLPGSGNIALSGVGSQQQEAQFTQVKNLRVGPAEMLNQQFVISPLPAFLEDRGNETPIAGLIGYEFLRRFPTTFNYQKKLLVFHMPGSEVTAPPDAQPFRLYFDSHTPLIQVTVDDARGYFGIDTGDNSVTTIFGPFYDAHRFPIEQPAQNKAEHGFGGGNAAILTRIASLSFGSYSLTHPLLNVTFAGHGIFSNDSVAGNLGSQVLNNFVFTLDYEHHRGYFAQSSEFGKATPYNRSGMTLHREKNSAVTVDRVTPDTPAGNAGFQPGDVIQSINNKSPDKQALSQFESILSGVAGTKLEIRYSRGNQEMHLTLQLSELLPVDGGMRPYIHD